MKYPNFNEEKKLWKQGFKCVAGLDEAGRGPLAGPVTAAAVIFKFEILNLKSILNNSIFKKINDSKKMTAKTREEVYDFLVKHPNIEWGVGIVSEKIIDKINILEATKLAMAEAIKDLDCATEYLLLDGNFKINTRRLRQGYGEPRQKSIIKGDQKVVSISAASIIAKVTRDKIMYDYDKKYPQYGFAKHKGYGTEFHMQRIREFGLCKIHRKSFRSIY